MCFCSTTDSSTSACSAIANIVLIDALDPLGGGVFPLGRLREPFAALARATAVVITRAENRHCGIEQLIRRYNSHAPIFRARSCSRRGRACRPARSQHSADWASRGRFGERSKPWGSKPRRVWCFRDHHRYTAADLEEIGRQAAGRGRTGAGDHRKRYDESSRRSSATAYNILFAHRDRNRERSGTAAAPLFIA